MIDAISDRIRLVAGDPGNPQIYRAVLNSVQQAGISNPTRCIRTACMSVEEWPRHNPMMRPDLAGKFVGLARNVVAARMAKMGLTADWSAVDGGHG